MKPSAWRMPFLLCCAAAALVFAAAAACILEGPPRESQRESCAAPDEIEARIRFYSAQLAHDPRLYPTLALLGKAYLDRIRWTGDARDLAVARDCLQRSIDIQPNLAAYEVLAAVANYSHRFQDALHWCDLAAEAAPGDPEILAMRTEALLALDRPGEVDGLLRETDSSGSLHALACRGMRTAAGAHPLNALPDFEAAARLADQLAAREESVWARVAAAAVFLDSDRAAEAEPYLRAAEQIDPNDYDLQVHLAEFEEGTGREAQALARYEHLLTLRCDAEVHRRAHVLAMRLRLNQQADRHYESAERLWRTALDHGEVYPLEGLARLYCDAGRNVDAALRLAERNLEFKRDRSARETHLRAKAACLGPRRDLPERPSPGVVRKGSLRLSMPSPSARTSDVPR